MTDKADSLIESMDDIEASLDTEYATIDGFTKGTTLRIASLTAGDFIEWLESNESAKHTIGLRLICKSLVNSAGERYASDLKNIAVFKKKSRKSIERVIADIVKLNNLEMKDEKAKKVEEAAKNA